MGVTSQLSTAEGYHWIELTKSFFRCIATEMWWQIGLALFNRNIEYPGISAMSGRWVSATIWSTGGLSSVWHSPSAAGPPPVSPAAGAPAAVWQWWSGQSAEWLGSGHTHALCNPEEPALLEKEDDPLHRGTTCRVCHRATDLITWDLGGHRLHCQVEENQFLMCQSEVTKPLINY